MATTAPARLPAMAEPRPRLRPGDRVGAPQGRRPPPHRQRRGVGGIWRFTILLALWAAIVGVCALGFFALTLPDTSRLTVAERRPGVTILAADGSTLASFGDLFGRPLGLREMAPALPRAVVAAEDRRFYRHFGVDPIGLLRAAI